MNKFALLAVLLMGVSVAWADQPTVINCNVEYAYEGDEAVTLFNLPDGSGSPFTEAHLPDGTIVDATLRVQILDAYNNPVAFFPAEDLWLESVDGALAICIGGTIADEDTDENGWTVWAEPLGASGHSQSRCTLLVSGMYAQGWVNLDLRFNSADINGDGAVNLADLGLFSSYYYGAYTFEADLFFDGALNLVDVAYFARGAGTSCP